MHVVMVASIALAFVMSQYVNLKVTPRGTRDCIYGNGQSLGATLSLCHTTITGQCIDRHQQWPLATGNHWSIKVLRHMADRRCCRMLNFTVF